MLRQYGLLSRHSWEQLLQQSPHPSMQPLHPALRSSSVSSLLSRFCPNIAIFNFSLISYFQPILFCICFYYFSLFFKNITSNTLSHSFKQNVFGTSSFHSHKTPDVTRRCSTYKSGLINPLLFSAFAIYIKPAHGSFYCMFKYTENPPPVASPAHFDI